MLSPMTSKLFPKVFTAETPLVKEFKSAIIGLFYLIYDCAGGVIDAEVVVVATSAVGGGGGVVIPVISLVS